MAVIVALLRFLHSVRSDGTVQIADAVGAIGTVYLTVPASGATGGQVTVVFRNRQETLAAVTEGGEAIPSGDKVKVVRLLDSNTLVVARLV
jgi:hypothetical protein